MPWNGSDDARADKLAGKKTLNDTCDEGETRNETFWGDTNAVLLAESLSRRTVVLLKYETFSI